MLKRSDFFYPVQVKTIRALIVLFEVGHRHVPNNFARVWNRDRDVGLSFARHPSVGNELIVGRLFWRQEQLHSAR